MFTMFLRQKRLKIWLSIIYLALFENLKKKKLKIEIHNILILRKWFLLKIYNSNKKFGIIWVHHVTLK